MRYYTYDTFLAGLEFFDAGGGSLGKLGYSPVTTNNAVASLGTAWSYADVNILGPIT